MLFNPLALVVMITGGFLLFKLRFFFILHPFRTAHLSFRALRSHSVMRSFCLALAGTLGVGNVFGVCVGLLIGGAGSVFWMLVSVIFASVLKYAEVVLTRDNLKRDETRIHGGMLYVIKNRMGGWGRSLSTVYAFGVLLLALFMGGALQVVSVCQSVEMVFPKLPAFFSLCLIILIFIAVAGGGEIIKKVTLYLIPAVSVIYVILTVSVIAIHGERLPSAIELIFKEAFTVNGAVGGMLAFFVSGGFKEGFSRGLLSNEAGAGTSCIAHAESGILNPALAGLMGILEVLFDTAFLCLLTAFAVLVSVPDFSSYEGGMSLIISAARGTLGDWSQYALLFAVFGFAFSTVICWYYYGAEVFAYLFGEGKEKIFIAIYILFCSLGTFTNDIILLSVTDIVLLIITCISCSALIKNSDRVKALSELGGTVKRTGKSYRRDIKGIEFLKGSRR